VTNAIGTCTSQDMEIAVTKALEQSVWWAASCRWCC